MAAYLVITFDLPEEQTEAWAMTAHRILNFNEELYRLFDDERIASFPLSDVDRAIASRRVKIKSASKIARAKTMAGKLVSQHFPEGLGNLTVVRE